MMTKKNVVGFAAMFSVASVWFSTHAGGGFASGTQGLAYFSQFGWYSLFLPLLSMGLLAFVLYQMILFSTKRKLYTYSAVFKELFQPYPKLAIGVDLYYNLVILAAVGAAIAGAASLLVDLGLTYAVGVLLVSACLVVLTIFGAGLIRAASTVMGIVIIVTGFSIFGIGIVSEIDVLGTVVATRDSFGTSFGEAAWKAFVYANFQCVAVTICIACSQHLTTRKSVAGMSIWGFVLNGVGAGLAALMIVAWMGALQSAPADSAAMSLPVLYITKQLNSPILYLFYFITLFFCFLSTGVTNVFTIVNRYETLLLPSTTGALANLTVKRSVMSIVLIGLCMSISFLGLNNIVTYGYQLCSYFAMAFITLPALTIAVAKNRRPSEKTLETPEYAEIVQGAAPAMIIREEV